MPNGTGRKGGGKVPREDDGGMEYRARLGISGRDKTGLRVHSGPSQGATPGHVGSVGHVGRRT
jgi:hypothetical protein